jgi:hypothetical protein
MASAWSTPIMLQGNSLFNFIPERTSLMLRKIDWESQIGRRLKLRDLHVFSTVVQRGSMAKARDTSVFPTPRFPR